MGIMSVIIVLVLIMVIVLPIALLISIILRRKLAIIVFGVLISSEIALYLSFIYFDMRGSWASDRLIKHMIQTKDKLEINQVSYDAQTKEFLLNLPTSTIPKRTSDSQGDEKTNTGGIEYLGTTLNGKAISVYISYNTTGFLGSLFPSYSLKQIRLWGNVQK